MSAAPGTTIVVAYPPANAVERQTCNHGACDCAVDRVVGVEAREHVYCGEGCASGRGCNHAGCACAEPIALGAGVR